jgi:inhibitor of cysteine peptidase
MRKITIFLASSFVGLLAFTGCGGASGPTATPPPAGTPTVGMVEGQAMVESVEVRIPESMPVQVQVQVVVKGNLPDACTKIGDIAQVRDGDSFNITIASTRQADLICAQVITPFEETINLDVTGLKAGAYTVTVNGVTEMFELTADNVAP